MIREVPIDTYLPAYLIKISQDGCEVWSIDTYLFDHYVKINGTRYLAYCSYDGCDIVEHYISIWPIGSDK